MTSFANIFGGNNIYPSQPTYLLLNPLTANIVLDWPIEQSMAGNNVVADIIDVNATVGGLTISLSNAEQVSTGYTALFNNIGANTFTVLNSSGGVLATIASGTVWQLYLSDNTTTQGTWRVFQFGAGASSANAAALAGAGLVALTTTLNQNYVTQSKSANYVSVIGDRSTLLEWTGGTGTLSVPGAGTIPAGWFVAVKNSGSGIWTISVATGADIDGQTTLALNPEQSCFLIFDGTNYATLGLGQQLNSVFDFVSISLTGQVSPFTLTGADLNRISYQFTGVLTANMVVVVPSTVQQYWINNQTTGAFTLTFETPTPGITTAVAQGNANILYSDGTNVIPAVTLPPPGSAGFPNGSSGAPSIFFASDTTTGFYRKALGEIGISGNGVNLGYIATGSVSCSLTGMTGTVNVTVDWFRIGNLVGLNIQAATGTSNSTSMTLTGLPADVIPTLFSAVVPLHTLEDNSVAFHQGVASLNTGGTMTFLLGDPASPTGFTASGTKGVSQSSLTYFVE